MSKKLLNMLKEGDSTTFLGNLFQCSAILTVKKRFLVFRGNSLCFTVFQFVPVACVPVALHHGKEPSSILFTSPLQTFTCIDKVLLSPVFFRLNSPSCLSLSSLSSHPAHTSQRWGFYGRQFKRPCCSPGRQYPLLSPCWPGQSQNCRILSRLSSMFSPWWLFLMTLLSLMCLEMLSRISCFITFPGIEVKLTGL